MAKKINRITKENEKVEKEMELFDAPKTEVVEETPVNQVEEMEMEMEVDAVETTPEVTSEVEDAGMELELDGEEVQNDMEELVAEKVKKEEKEHKEQKSKRGPKPGNKKEEKEDEEKPAEKKEKALNLADLNIIQREIKKGRLSAPQGRIEKTEAGDYILKLADGIIFPQDAQGNFKEVNNIAKMNDGKYILTKHAADSLNTKKFKAKHESGEEVEHDYVRVELHKPGREKDVIELFTVRAAEDFLKVQDAKSKKKEDVANKKAEKEKAEKEKTDKEATDKETVDNKETAVS